MPIDTEAQFTEVYRAHYADVLRFVHRRAHPMNVDDIVGETFLAAWRRRRELPEDPRPWLFGTARKVMLNAHRGMRRHTALAVRIRQAAETGGHDRAADPTSPPPGRHSPPQTRRSSPCRCGSSSQPRTRRRSSAARAPRTPCA
jgi:RNA polymerase sigma-70 factor (ECF subfamily)